MSTDLEEVTEILGIKLLQYPVKNKCNIAVTYRLPRAKLFSPKSIFYTDAYVTDKEIKYVYSIEHGVSSFVRRR